LFQFDEYHALFVQLDSVHRNIRKFLLCNVLKRHSIRAL